VHGHLISVKVSVKRGTSEWMKLDRFTLNESRTKGLDTQTMQSWRTIQKYTSCFGKFFENIPNFSIPSKLFPSLIKTSNFDKQIINPYFGMNMATSQKTNFETLKERDEYYNSLLKESFKETAQDKIPTSGIYKEVVSSSRL
jgi:hypothetical protein